MSSNTNTLSESSMIPSEFSKVATLCTAKDAVIGSQVVLGVDARALHEGLGVRRDFATWVKGRIHSLGLEEGIDYELLPSLEKTGKNFDSPKRGNQKSQLPKTASGLSVAGIPSQNVSSPKRGSATLICQNGRTKKRGGDQRSKNYTLTLEAAKHIAMVEKNEMGRLIRSYFIWIEKQKLSTHASLTAREVGGIAKGVVHKAVAPMLEELVSLRSQLERVAGSCDPSATFITGYRTMSAVVNEHQIPPCGRRGLVVKCSNRCARFLQRNGMGGMIRCTREKGTRIFYQDGLEKWLLAEGKEILINARDIAVGQNVIPFPRPNRRTPHTGEQA